jgi:hypothetical protein
MSFYHPFRPLNLHGKTLVVVSVVTPSGVHRRGLLTHRFARQPVVSAANVAQLAADLLIASLSLRLVGVFDSCDLVPVVGGRDDGEEGVCTPLEREPLARFRLRVFPILATQDSP